MKVPRVLIVAGSDSGGGAGIQADLKTVSALGAFGMTAITALTAQNTTGVLGVLTVDSAFVRRQIDACVTDIGCDAVKTGMLVSARTIETVAERVAAGNLRPLIVDPVLIATTGEPLLEAEAITALRDRLFPLAAVVTPNLHEAGVILGREVASIGGMRDAARAIRAMGPGIVVVKGGHLAGPAIDVVFDGREIHELSAERIEGAEAHGTGCIFASAIAACLARGDGALESIRTAKGFVTAAIRGRLTIGRGRSPADPLAPRPPRSDR